MFNIAFDKYFQRKREILNMFLKTIFSILFIALIVIVIVIV